MAKQDIKAGGAFVELSVRKAKFLRGLRDASERLKAVGGTFRNVGMKITGAGGAIAAPFVGAVAIFEKVGDSLNKMAIRTGISVESLSQLRFAAERSGSSLEDVEKAVLKMNRRLGRLTAGLGSGSEKDALAELGFSAEQLDRMSPEQKLLAIADAMSKFEDKAEAAGLAQRAFGTGVDKVLPLLLQGRDGIKGLMQEADSLGLTIGSDSAQAAAEFSDALGTLKDQAKAAFFQIGAAVAGPLTKFIKTLKPALKNVIEWSKENRALVMSVAAVGAGLVAVGGTLMAFGFALSGVGMALGTVASVLGVVLSPMGFLVAAIAGGTVAFFKFTEAGQALGQTFGKVFGDIGGIAKETFGGIADALKAGDIELAGEIATLGVKTAWERVLVEIRKMMDNDFVKAITEAVLMVKDFFVGAFRVIRNFWSGEFTSTLKDSFLDAVAAISGGIVLLVGHLRSAFAMAEQFKWANAVEKAEEEIQRRRTRIIATMEEIRGSMEDTFDRAGLTTGQRVELGRQLTGTREEHAAGLQQARELGMSDKDVAALEMSAKRLLHLNRERHKLDDKTLSNIEKLNLRNDAVLDPARKEKELIQKIANLREGISEKPTSVDVEVETPKLKSLADQLREKVQQAAAAAAGAKETGDDKPGGGGVVVPKPELIAGGSFGTFSAAALGFMGARGMGPQDRIAKNSELTLAEIVRLANNVDKWNQGLGSLIPVVVD